MEILRSAREIEQMRKAGLLVWEAHQLAASVLGPGVTTAEIDAVVEEFFDEHNAVPLFKGVPGQVPFPAVTCISINEEVVHGIPSGRKDGVVTQRLLTPSGALPRRSADCWTSPERYWR